MRRVAIASGRNNSRWFNYFPLSGNAAKRIHAFVPFKLRWVSVYMLKYVYIFKKVLFGCLCWYTWFMSIYMRGWLISIAPFRLLCVCVCVFFPIQPVGPWVVWRFAIHLTRSAVNRRTRSRQCKRTTAALRAPPRDEPRRMSDHRRALNKGETGKTSKDRFLTGRRTQSEFQLIGLLVMSFFLSTRVCNNELEWFWIRNVYMYLFDCACYKRYTIFGRLYSIRLMYFTKSCYLKTKKLKCQEK